MVLISVICGDTSCAMSLSPVEISTLRFCFRGRAGQRADHVVGLHARLAQDGQAHAAHRFEQRLDLRAQVVGHGRAMRLVFGEQLVAERLARSVEHHGDALGIVVLEELREHVQHAEHRAGGLAARIAERRQRVKRAIQVRRAVDQDEIGAGVHALFRRRRRGVLVFLDPRLSVGRFLGRGHFRRGRWRCRRRIRRSAVNSAPRCLRRRRRLRGPRDHFASAPRVDRAGLSGHRPRARTRMQHRDANSARLVSHASPCRSRSASQPRTTR